MPKDLRTTLLRKVGKSIFDGNRWSYGKLHYEDKIIGWMKRPMSYHKTYIFWTLHSLSLYKSCFNLTLKLPSGLSLNFLLILCSITKRLQNFLPTHTQYKRSYWQNRIIQDNFEMHLRFTNNLRLSHCI